MDENPRPLPSLAAPEEVADVSPPPRTVDGLDRAHVERLLAEARAGSASALGELLAACRKYLTSIANRSVNDALKVKIAPSDLVQETALDACRAFSTFQGQQFEELLAWLQAILLNNVASAGRRYQGAQKRNLAREVPLRFESAGCGNVKDLAPTPRSLLAAVEEQQRVEAAINRLPADQRSAILLRHRDHLSFAEMGVALGRSMQAAHKLWCRAVLRLQQELKERDDSEPGQSAARSP